MELAVGILERQAAVGRALVEIAQGPAAVPLDPDRLEAGRGHHRLRERALVRLRQLAEPPGDRADLRSLRPGRVRGDRGRVEAAAHQHGGRSRRAELRADRRGEQLAEPLDRLGLAPRAQQAEVGPPEEMPPLSAGGERHPAAGGHLPDGAEEGGVRAPAGAAAKKAARVASSRSRGTPRTSEEDRRLAGDQEPRRGGVPAQHALAGRIARQVGLALLEVQEEQRPGPDEAVQGLPAVRRQEAQDHRGIAGRAAPPRKPSSRPAPRGCRGGRRTAARSGRPDRRGAGAPRSPRGSTRRPGSRAPPSPRSGPCRRRPAARRRPGTGGEILDGGSVEADLGEKGAHAEAVEEPAACYLWNPPSSIRSRVGQSGHVDMASREEDARCPSR